MYERWEEGTQCYEDPEDCTGFLGHAVKLSADEEDQIIAALKELGAAEPVASPERMSAHDWMALHGILDTCKYSGTELAKVMERWRKDTE